MCRCRQTYDGRSGARTAPRGFSAVNWPQARGVISSGNRRLPGQPGIHLQNNLRHPPFGRDNPPSLLVNPGIVRRSIIVRNTGEPSSPDPGRALEAYSASPPFSPPLVCRSVDSSPIHLRILRSSRRKIRDGRTSGTVWSWPCRPVPYRPYVMPSYGARLVLRLVFDSSND